MQILSKKISELKRPERNVRLHGDRQIREYIRSVEMFGQIRPLVIDEDNVVICGNGLLQAFQQMGKETAECYVVTGLSESQKKKLMLADNRIYELGVNDSATLDSILQELAGDIDIPGYDEELLKVLVASAREADNYITQYGKFSEETLQRMNNVKPLNASLTVQNSPSYQPQQQNLNSDGEISADQATGENFCTCPRCGFKFHR